MKKVAILICMLMLMASVQVQTITVSGIVTGAEDKDPLPGVSILVEGTSNGTITDVDGKYKITCNKGAILVFSYIGCKTKKVAANNSTINVELEEDRSELAEYVVSGVSKVPRTSRVSKNEVSEVIVDMKVQSEISALAFAAPVRNSVRYDIGNNEEYKGIVENRFRTVTDEPLSTFSIDVDAASYSNMRRYINQGVIPDANAIRTEELINYFNYNYNQPEGNDPVGITTEVGECPWKNEHRLVRIGIKAKDIATEKLPASNLVFLIDVSGSMYGPTRLDLVKSSLKLLVNNLRAKDKVAIVVYAGSAGEVLPSTPGSDKQKILEALNKLEAGGSTAGGAGIKMAYKIAAKNFIEGGNNRVILCTDGDFNVGVSSAGELESLIEKERSSGVFLTVLGYGMGNYKDGKMQSLAEKGNGNHAYIDNLQEANKVLVNEFGGTIFTVAKDVKLQIEFNPGHVQAYRLIGYESRMLNKEDFNDDKKDAGEMGAGHTVTAFYEVIPVGVKSNYGSVDKLKYQQPEPSKLVQNVSSPEMLTVKLRYKHPDEDISKKIEVALIDRNRDEVSADFRFGAAVAMFSQVLRNSDFKGTGTYGKAIELASQSYGEDVQGYRREFVRLAEAVKNLDK